MGDAGHPLLDINHFSNSDYSNGRHVKTNPSDLHLSLLLCHAGGGEHGWL
jgi:hypothetical protein